MIIYVDVAYTTDIQKCHSTTGFVLTNCGGVVVYRSETQTVTALRSTEAKFLATVSCATIILYLRSIPVEFGFSCDGPTEIYENYSFTIMIVNSQVPTERAWYIHVQ